MYVAWLLVLLISVCTLFHCERIFAAPSCDWPTKLDFQSKWRSLQILVNKSTKALPVVIGDSFSGKRRSCISPKVSHTYRIMKDTCSFLDLSNALSMEMLKNLAVWTWTSSQISLRISEEMESINEFCRRRDMKDYSGRLCRCSVEYIQQARANILPTATQDPINYLAMVLTNLPDVLGMLSSVGLSIQ